MSRGMHVIGNGMHIFDWNIVIMSYCPGQYKWWDE
jgi:hypothetical protein